MEFSYKLLISVLLLPIIARCSADPIFQACGKNFSSATNDLMKNNINHALSNLIANTSLNGFAISTDGVGSDAIYGLARTRGDISREKGLACVLDAVNKIQTSCPFSAEAIILSEFCLVRYDSTDFLGVPSLSYQTFFSSHVATDPADFDQAVEGLMGEVKASAGAGENRFGRGERNVLNSNMTVYGMAQCTPDLQQSACDQCLSKALEIMLSENHKFHLGCYVISISCVMRYEVNPFLVDPIAPRTPVALAPVPAPAHAPAPASP